ncbi:hypothetical protein [Thalassococcus sp. S3]|uniref:hypothetical protein n=1 Tax=Thalassococcus sp. S3 TaxID=2017482 RepID=UPI00102446EA|nr:hypothetical protein [Thalassococcus sp. S3]QBF31144.1 hypothetical protein CFI11_07910 [Thalassococcus sp. S3]
MTKTDIAAAIAHAVAACPSPNLSEKTANNVLSRRTVFSGADVSCMSGNVSCQSRPFKIASPQNSCETGNGNSGDFPESPARLSAPERLSRPARIASPQNSCGPEKGGDGGNDFPEAPASLSKFGSLTAHAQVAFPEISCRADGAATGIQA